MISPSFTLYLLVLTTSVASFSTHPNAGRVSGSVNFRKDPVKMEAELKPKLLEKVSGTSQRVNFRPVPSKPAGIVVHPLQNKTSGSTQSDLHKKVALIRKADTIQVNTSEVTIYKRAQESSPSVPFSNLLRIENFVLEIGTAAEGNMFRFKGKLLFK